jgi:anti-sigma factor RsiW
LGNLHHLHDEHEQAQMLLPWHVNGTLEPAEAAWFEAHLAGCAECRADFEANLALRQHVAATPIELEPLRVPLLDRIGARNKPSTASPWDFLRRRITLGWALAGQVAFAAVAAMIVLTLAPPANDDEFELLGSETGAAEGNAIVLFAPETTERDLRGALDGAGARIVDGPTASGAYIVHLAAGERNEALDRLRALPQVVLAEPIDAGAP